MKNTIIFLPYLAQFFSEFEKLQVFIENYKYIIHVQYILFRKLRNL